MKNRQVTLFSDESLLLVKKAVQAKEKELGFKIGIGPFIRMIVLEYLKEKGL